MTLSKLVSVIKHARNESKTKVKIQNRSVYHKFAEVEIEIPKDWNDKDGVKDYYDGYLLDYLHDNEDLYADKMDEAMVMLEDLMMLAAQALEHADMMQKGAI